MQDSGPLTSLIDVRTHAGAIARVASDHCPLKAIISLDGGR